MVHWVEVQGHRGSRGTRPENTLVAFADAIEAGVDVLELDLLITQDERVVIHHDYFINTELCAFLDGKPLLDAPLVRSLNLSMIKKLDCGGKVNPQFPNQVLIPGTQIPTLKELFSLIQNSSHPNAKKVSLNLEIKRNSKHPEFTLRPSEIVKLVLDEVELGGFMQRVYFSSFDSEVLSQIYEINPNARRGFIYCPETLKELHKMDSLDEAAYVIKMGSKLKVEILSPHHSLLKDEEDVRVLKQAGFKVIPWVINEEKRGMQLIEMGVDGIITDYPQKLIEFLKNKNLH